MSSTELFYTRLRAIELRIEVQEEKSEDDNLCADVVLVELRESQNFLIGVINQVETRGVA